MWGTNGLAAVPVPALVAGAGEAGEEGLARITVRMPESIKNRADDAAAAAGQSLNTWLVNLVRSATSDTAIHVDVDLNAAIAAAGVAQTAVGHELPGALLRAGDRLLDS